MTLASRLQNLFSDSSDTPAAASARDARAAAPADPINLDHTYATRSSQLAAARDAADNRLAEQRAVHQRAMQQLERDHLDRMRALSQADQAVQAMLRTVLVRDAHAAFEPLVVRWRDDSSRATALALLQAFSDLVRRERELLGPLPARPHVLLALSHIFIDCIAQVSPGVIITFAHDQSTSRVVGALAAVMGQVGLPALEGRPVSSAIAERLIAELEAAVEASASAHSNAPIEARTLARWRAVRAQDPEAIAAHDAELAREHQERAKAACEGWAALINAQSEGRTSNNEAGSVEAFR